MSLGLRLKIRGLVPVIWQGGFHSRGWCWRGSDYWGRSILVDNEQVLLEPHDRISGHSFSSAGLRPQQGAAPEAFEVGLQFSCSPSGWVCNNLLGRQSVFVTFCCYIPGDLCSLMCHVNIHILQLDSCLVDLIEKSFPCGDDFLI